MILFALSLHIVSTPAAIAACVLLVAVTAGFAVVVARLVNQSGQEDRAGGVVGSAPQHRPRLGGSSGQVAVAHRLSLPSHCVEPYGVTLRHALHTLSSP